MMAAVGRAVGGWPSSAPGSSARRSRWRRRAPASRSPAGTSIPRRRRRAAAAGRLVAGDLLETRSREPTSWWSARRSARSRAVVAAALAATTGARGHRRRQHQGLGVAARSPRSVAPSRSARGSCRDTRWAGASDPGPSTPRRRSSTASSGCVAPTDATDRHAVDAPRGVGRGDRARGPSGCTPERHDRLVAFVSHLPQVASTSLMGLAATEEADEPEILLLAAGGFRDLTRLASSNPRCGARSSSRTASRSPRRSTSTSTGSARCATTSIGSRRRRRRGDVRGRRSALACGSPPSRRCGRAWPCSGRRSRTEPGALAELTADPRGGPREHRGPADRALARGRAGDRAPDRGRRPRRTRRGRPASAAASIPSGWREASDAGCA